MKMCLNFYSHLNLEILRNFKSGLVLAQGVYLNFDTRHRLKIKVHKHVLELA